MHESRYCYRMERATSDGISFMNNSLPLPEDKKLSVTYRVEPGCLGPEGKTKIDEFCDFAQRELRSLDSDYVSSNYVFWIIVPRSDKTLPEMQYSVVGKRMNHSQAEKYLAVFDKSLDEFEGYLGDKLATLIDEFMGQ